ncbi:MAG: radical SAM protein [Candidatus Nanopelagicales bacterium]
MNVPRVALITLGCARNEVDSEELAQRFDGAGFELVPGAAGADVVVVNTCGFVESAKRESVETLLAAAGTHGDAGRPKVVAVGCMAERYGIELAEALPEADAVLGFDDYPEIVARLRTVMAGGTVAAHVPRDRRTLLPLAPVDRAGGGAAVPGHGAAARPARPAAQSVAVGAGEPWKRRLVSTGPVAPLKIASGCDRRCAFCAIPLFRGSLISRSRADIVAEARWLAEQGVSEVVLVSENSTSYGKDHAEPRALERLLTELAGVDGLERIRVSYLQPAEVRPSLLAAMLGTRKVADYFDLSFQHASAGLLRRMRRFGSSAEFLALIGQIRESAPRAGIRSNVIVGFPGETEEDLAELIDFLGEAQMDAVGVFGYSQEEGTEAAGMSGALDEDEIRARVGEVASLADEVMSQRAEGRIGDPVDVLIDAVDGMHAEGRAEHQGPEDGTTRVRLSPGRGRHLGPGSVLRARVRSSEGVDLDASEASDVLA